MEMGITKFNITTQCENIVPRIVAEGKDNPFVTLLIITLIIFLFTVIYYRYQVSDFCDLATQNRPPTLQPTFGLPPVGLSGPTRIPSSLIFRIKLTHFVYLNAKLTNPNPDRGPAVGHHQPIYVASRPRKIIRLQALRLFHVITIPTRRQSQVRSPLRNKPAGLVGVYLCVGEGARTTMLGLDE